MNVNTFTPQQLRILLIDARKTIEDQRKMILSWQRTAAAGGDLDKFRSITLDYDLLDKQRAVIEFILDSKETLQVHDCVVNDADLLEGLENFLSELLRVRPFKPTKEEER